MLRRWKNSCAGSEYLNALSSSVEFLHTEIPGRFLLINDFQYGGMHPILVTTEFRNKLSRFSVLGLSVGFFLFKNGSIA